MELFTLIEGEVCHLRAGGVFSQAKLFRRGKDLFAAKGSGFIRLLDNGNTSHPSTFWDGISLPKSKYAVADHGRIQLKGKI